MERIKISERDKILKIIRGLDKDLEAGNISKRQHDSLKKEYSSQLENLEAAARIRRLQGRGKVEKSLDHWAEKSKEEKEEIEKKKLVDKYVTSPKSFKTQKQSSKTSKPKIKMLTAVFLALAFFIGSGFGIYMLNIPTSSHDGTVLVNDTAFPTFEDTRDITQDISETTVTPTEDTRTPIRDIGDGRDSNDANNGNDGENGNSGSSGNSTG